MNARRSSSALIAGILVAAGFLLSPPAPAHAASWCSGTTFRDFDTDDHADLVVARTLPATQAGVVDVVLSGGGTQTISAASLGFASAPGYAFGASIHIGTIDTTDNCPDLVIGSPGAAGGGAVYLVRGNGDGVAGTATRVACVHPVPEPAQPVLEIDRYPYQSHQEAILGDGEGTMRAVIGHRFLDIDLRLGKVRHPALASHVS